MATEPLFHICWHR